MKQKLLSLYKKYKKHQYENELIKKVKSIEIWWSGIDIYLKNDMKFRIDDSNNVLSSIRNKFTRILPTGYNLETVEIKSNKINIKYKRQASYSDTLEFTTKDKKIAREVKLFLMNNLKSKQQIDIDLSKFSL